MGMSSGLALIQVPSKDANQIVEKGNIKIDLCYFIAVIKYLIKTDKFG